MTSCGTSKRQHAHIASLADATRNMGGAPQPMMDPGIVDMVKRELSDIRFSQSETDRRTQDSLETVHNTLGHVVDRLATDRLPRAVVAELPHRARQRLIVNT